MNPFEPPAEGFLNDELVINSPAYSGLTAERIDLMMVMVRHVANQVYYTSECCHNIHAK